MVDVGAIIINGAISGAVFSLLALGFTLIYGVSGVVNLAHGVFFMLGAYMFSSFSSLLGEEVEGILVVSPLALLLSVILAAITVAIVAAIVYKLAIGPVIEDEVAVLVVTVSIAIVFQQIILLLFTPAFHPVPSLLRGYTIFWGLTLTYQRVMSFVVSLVLFAILWIFIAKTKIGGAMRAVSQDREVAMLMGVNTERLYMLTMAISGAFAAIAGIFIASTTTGVANAFMWLEPLALSFSIVILGGLGSIKGTIVGGFIIGYSEIIVTTIYPEIGAIVPAVPFGIMLLVLTIRPKGLFGKRIEMEE